MASEKCFPEKRSRSVKFIILIVAIVLLCFLIVKDSKAENSNTKYADQEQYTAEMQRRGHSTHFYREGSYLQATHRLEKLSSENNIFELEYTASGLPNIPISDPNYRVRHETRCYYRRRLGKLSLFGSAGFIRKGRQFQDTFSTGFDLSLGKKDHVQMAFKTDMNQQNGFDSMYLSIGADNLVNFRQKKNHSIGLAYNLMYKVIKQAHYTQSLIAHVIEIPIQVKNKVFIIPSANIQMVKNTINYGFLLSMKILSF